MNFRNNLGYEKNKEGICAGYAEVAIDAFLIGEIEAFYQRIEFIYKTRARRTFFTKSVCD